MKYSRHLSYFLRDHFNMTSSAFRPFCYHHPPSHHAITKLGIPYHLPTCHQLLSLGKQKKKEETNKESCCCFFLCLKPSKRETSFFLTKTKTKKRVKQVKKEVVVFCRQKGNVFFHFEQLKKGTNKQSCTA